MKKKHLFLYTMFMLVLMSAFALAEEGIVPMTGTSAWGAILMKWAMNLGWIITASIGFGVGTGIAIKMFDLISVDINEWEEVKKGNMGVVAILVSIIVMVGIIVVVSIR